MHRKKTENNRIYLLSKLTGRGENNDGNMASVRPGKSSRGLQAFYDGQHKCESFATPSPVHAQLI